jgi:hypothetical protein
MILQSNADRFSPLAMVLAKRNWSADICVLSDAIWVDAHHVWNLSKRLAFVKRRLMKRNTATLEVPIVDNNVLSH